MILELKNVEFVNDIFSTVLPDGSYIALNKVEESFVSSTLEGTCDVSAINIEIITPDETIDCPRVIGLGNELMRIYTEHKEYEGDILTPENMEYCMIEVYDL